MIRKFKAGLFFGLFFIEFAFAPDDKVVSSKGVTLSASNTNSNTLSASVNPTTQPAPSLRPNYSRDSSRDGDGPFIYVGVKSLSEPNVHVFRDDKSWYYVPTDGNGNISGGVTISSTSEDKQEEASPAQAPAVDPLAAGLGALGAVAGVAALAGGAVLAKKLYDNKQAEKSATQQAAAEDKLVEEDPEVKKALAKANGAVKGSAEEKAAEQELNNARVKARTNLRTPALAQEAKLNVKPQQKPKDAPAELTDDTEVVAAPSSVGSRIRAADGSAFSAVQGVAGDVVTRKKPEASSNEAFPKPTAEKVSDAVSESLIQGPRQLLAPATITDTGTVRAVEAGTSEQEPQPSLPRQNPSINLQPGAQAQINPRISVLTTANAQLKATKDSGGAAAQVPSSLTPANFTDTRRGVNPAITITPPPETTPAVKPKASPVAATAVARPGSETEASVQQPKGSTQVQASIVPAPTTPTLTKSTSRDGSVIPVLQAPKLGEVGRSGGQVLPGASGPDEADSDLGVTKSARNPTPVLQARATRASTPQVQELPEEADSSPASGNDVMVSAGSKVRVNNPRINPKSAGVDSATDLSIGTADAPALAKPLLQAPAQDQVSPSAPRRTLSSGADDAPSEPSVSVLQKSPGQVSPSDTSATKASGLSSGARSSTNTTTEVGQGWQPPAGIAPAVFPTTSSPAGSTAADTSASAPVQAPGKPLTQPSSPQRAAPRVTVAQDSPEPVGVELARPQAQSGLISQTYDAQESGSAASKITIQGSSMPAVGVSRATTITVAVPVADKQVDQKPPTQVPQDLAPSASKEGVSTLKKSSAATPLAEVVDNDEAGKSLTFRGVQSEGGRVTSASVVRAPVVRVSPVEQPSPSQALSQGSSSTIGVARAGQVADSIASARAGSPVNPQPVPAVDMPSPITTAPKTPNLPQQKTAISSLAPSTNSPKALDPESSRPVFQALNLKNVTPVEPLLPATPRGASDALPPALTPRTVPPAVTAPAKVNATPLPQPVSGKAPTTSVAPTPEPVKPSASPRPTASALGSLASAAAAPSSLRASPSTSLSDSSNRSSSTLLTRSDSTLSSASSLSSVSSLGSSRKPAESYHDVIAKQLRRGGAGESVAMRARAALEVASGVTSTGEAVENTRSTARRTQGVLSPQNLTLSPSAASARGLKPGSTLADTASKRSASMPTPGASQRPLSRGGKPNVADGPKLVRPR